MNNNKHSEELSVHSFETDALNRLLKLAQTLLESRRQA